MILFNITSVFSFVLIIFTFVLIIMAFIYGFKRFNSINKELAKQAKKRKGFFNNRFIGRSNIVFYHDNNEVKVEYIPGSKYSSPYIWLTIYVGLNKDKKIVVYNESIFSKIGRSLGLKDIQIGSDRFDDEFIIKSNDEYFVSRILDFYVQNNLLEIKKYHPNIKFINGNLNVFVPRILKNEREYDMLIEAGLLIYDRLKKFE